MRCILHGGTSFYSESSVDCLTLWVNPVGIGSNLISCLLLFVSCLKGHAE